MPTDGDVRPSTGRLIASIAGSLVFFFVAPGVIAFWIPWRLTGWHLRPLPPGWALMRPVGAALVLVGLLALAACFARFVVQGHGTPAPPIPPGGWW
jgi:hypothetical protein